MAAGSELNREVNNWIKQLVRFGGVGIFATIIHSLVALLLIKALLFGSTAANVCAFFAANGFSYTFNSLWSFQQKMRVATFTKFLTTSLITLVLIVLITKLSDQWGLRAEFSVLIVAAIIPFIGFVIHKFWTFKEEI